MKNFTEYLEVCTYVYMYVYTHAQTAASVRALEVRRYMYAYYVSNVLSPAFQIMLIIHIIAYQSFCVQ